MAFTVEHRPLQKRFEKEMEREKTREEKMISSLSPNLNIMIKACQKAGRRLLRDFGELGHLQVMQKAPKDFVTTADLKAEQIIMETLSEDRPDYGFISEEKGIVPAQNESNMNWILDPLDGTSNLIHALPYFSISLALMEGNEIIAGVIYTPISNELYYAEKGNGAFVMIPTGTRRLRVSGRTNLSESLLELTSLSSKNKFLSSGFADSYLAVRGFGAASIGLAHVAAGQVETYIGQNLKVWDMAAGYLLVKEAGGVLFNEEGKNDFESLRKASVLISCNEKNAQKIKQQLNIKL